MAEPAPLMVLSSDAGNATDNTIRNRMKPAGSPSVDHGDAILAAIRAETGLDGILII